MLFLPHPHHHHNHRKLRTLLLGHPLSGWPLRLCWRTVLAWGINAQGTQKQGNFPSASPARGRQGRRGGAGGASQAWALRGRVLASSTFFFTTAAFFSDYLTTARDNVVAKYQRNHRHSDLPPALSLLLILPHLLRPPPDLVLRRRRAPRREILFNLEDIPPRTTGRPWRILRLPRRNIMAGSAGADQAFLGLISSSYTYIHDTLYSSVDLELLRTP